MVLYAVLNCVIQGSFYEELIVEELTEQIDDMEYESYWSRANI
ncbi:MAG: hypothetical protein ACI4ED_01605 [Suilimivivens sp.]